jgi:hypothetical protein
MEAPTIFLIGKLSNVIDEVKKVTGSTHIYVSSGENRFRITLTTPELTNDINSINSMKEKMFNIFGLNEPDTGVTIEHSYRTTRLNLINKQQQLEIIIESR